MEIDFTEIKIVGLDDDMTVESPNNPALRYIYLKLSQTPPPLWQRHFADSRKIPRHTKWRHAWIDRKFIIVECVPTEIETHHLNDLKKDVFYANSKYREYLLQQVQVQKRGEHTQRIERDHLREMKSRLNFD